MLIFVIKYSNMEYNVTIDIQDLFNEDTQIELNGIFIKYNKYIYFATVGHNLPIKDYIYIDDQKFKIDIISKWNELLIVKFNKNIDFLKNKFVFHQFGKKQIFNDQYYNFSTESIRTKYISDEYFNLKLDPDNPRLLYYKFEFKNYNPQNGDCGKPVYDKNNKLIGILAKNQNNYGYIIPYIYIEKTITKDNNIYTNDLNISKIYNYKIRNDKVYYPILNKWIYIDCYHLLEGDENISCSFTKKSKTYFKKYKQINNNYNDQNIKKIINKNNIIIQINSSLLLLLNMINKDLLLNLLKISTTREEFNYETSSITYTFKLFNY